MLSYIVIKLISNSYRDSNSNSDREITKVWHIAGKHSIDFESYNLYISHSIVHYSRAALGHKGTLYC